MRAYVANYIRTEKISLNQTEVELFINEIIDEMCFARLQLICATAGSCAPRSAPTSFP